MSHPRYTSNNYKALSVILTSLAPYIFLLIVSHQLSFISYWWVVALALPTHWLHARMFIVMHDCGHRSFIKNRMLNDIFGHLTSFFYYTPFLMWRELHNKHHAYQGNLDKRGISLDIWTMTLNEYQKAGVTKKFSYRFYRNPVVLLLLSPLILFLGIFRIPFEKFSTQAIANIFLLDLVLLYYIFFHWSTFGLFLKIQIPSLFLSFSMAAFLFYVQHQFKNTMWIKDEKFNNTLIALKGSSYFKLPPFLNWAYGNIGFHNTHHLDVKIPMYYLPRASQQIQAQDMELTIRDSIYALNLKLWDESTQKLISFK